ncbi:peptide ABC transporter substrate-binding protein [Pasteurella bettyae]|uniref:ABC transporter, substrate-binding protein, family 5 n=1 Tax=Pasteurella bettyae CCUG 2042 TaxID=1095749 RepID=I3DIA8_9PAST|nr:peptide ABC transporter substrate-binding protein [Pasteurella bettyae]EIJ71451.1 ABC transporter, substrate-binding protein, family 5 [Pasteurella bettyae CCUG 2042]SUB21545.1 putative oligopeptide transporter [Pasteurella bettyae]
MAFSVFSSYVTFPIKSAVIFSCFLSITACDQVKSFWSKTAIELSPSSPSISNTAVNLSKQIRAQIEQENVLLVRGVYSDLVSKVTDIHSADQADFLRDILEGLVIFDAVGNIQPAVAQSWTTKDSKIWTFTLRKEAKWSNGEDVTAQDFVASWQQLALSKNPLKQYLAFMHIKNAQAFFEGKIAVEQLGIKALDDKHLQITLDKSLPYFPKMLAHISLLPIYSKAQDNVHHFFSNGAYQFAKQENDIISLIKNDKYWNASTVKFESVNYKKITAQSDLKGIDLIVDSKLNDIHVKYFPKLCTYFYEFNLKDPVLKNKAIRDALSSMVSSHTIVQNENLNVKNISHFVPEGMDFEQDSGWNPTVVEQILQQAQFSESNPLHLRITYEQDGVHSNIATRMIRAWSQSDLISVQTEPVSWQELQNKRAKGDFQLIRSGWCADYNDPSAFLNLLQSKNPDNKTGFNNQNVDNLLERLNQHNMSETDRNNLYQQILSIAQQEKVFLPIFQYMLPVYLTPSLQGYDINNVSEVIYSKDLSRKSFK